ncbi:MAG: DNA gyrase inhibitor YacG [Planctomycetota bacterium]|nr:MAG: DNA gyrase inhibitor YacG [Planctomycetota bacterium]
MRCPTCERQFEPDQSAALPFCSERCRSIDLGRWLGEDYALPDPRSLDEEQVEEPARNGEE